MGRIIGHHPSDETLLLAADGELTAAEHLTVHAHVAACAACSVRLQLTQSSLREADAAYRAEFGARPSPHPAGRERLEQSLKQLDETWARSWPTRARRALASPPVGLMLALAAPAVALSLWLSTPRPVDRTPAPAALVGPALPVASLTPGAVAPMTAAELCAGKRPTLRVSNETRARVLRDYRVEHVASDRYELDALITPELGGTTDAANLWPQFYASPVWGARVKDELEELLPGLVCSGQLDLAQAQQAMARDWIAAYKRFFRSDVPLRAHLGPAVPDDEPELEMPPVAVVSLLLLPDSDR